MNFKITEIATFFGAIALLAKTLDWYLVAEEKKRLHDHVSSLVKRGAVSGSTVVKAPLSIFAKLLDAALGAKILSWKAFNRSATLSILLLLGCLAFTGILTNTSFGISKTPWSAYDSTLLELEKIIESGSLKSQNSPTEKERIELEEHYASMREMAAQARSPVLKWVYLIFMVLASIFLGMFTTMTSLAFSRKVAKELQQTESIILISGAILLGLVVSMFVVNLCLVALYTISSPLVVFSGTLGRLLLGHSTLLGVGIASGYSMLAWLTSPSWAKAIAVGAVVPSLVIAILATISGMLYPIRTICGSFINNILVRSLRAEKGVLVFIATGATLLSAAIIMATNMIGNGHP